MKRIQLFFLLPLFFWGCKNTSLSVGTGFTAEVMDARYECPPNERTPFLSRMATVLAPYKIRVDSLMKPVVGESSEYMTAHRPQSLLTNLTADMLLVEARRWDSTVAMAFVNVGGIRSALPKGAITYGDVLEMLPFENRLFLMTLSGSQVRNLFLDLIRCGGEGISGATVTGYLAKTQPEESKVEKLLVNGKPIVDSANYRIATLDYLAEGNDGFLTLRQGTQRLRPQGNAVIRDLFLHYLAQERAKGKAVSAKIDDRIILKTEK